MRTGCFDEFRQQHTKLLCALVPVCVVLCAVHSLMPFMHRSQPHVTVLVSYQNAGLPYIIQGPLEQVEQVHQGNKLFANSAQLLCGLLS